MIVKELYSENFILFGFGDAITFVGIIFTTF